MASEMTMPVGRGDGQSTQTTKTEWAVLTEDMNLERSQTGAASSRSNARDQGLDIASSMG